MKFMFMLTPDLALTQASISVADDWDMIVQSNPDQIVYALRDLLVRWVENAQKSSDKSYLPTQAISLAALSKTATFTGDPAIFNPSEVDEEEYEVLTVEVWGAERSELTYEVVLSELGSGYFSALSDFDETARDTMKFIPESNGLQKSCQQLYAQTEALAELMRDGIEYFRYSERDTSEVQSILKTLSSQITDVDSLVQKIQNAALPQNWETKSDYSLGIPLNADDKENFALEATLTFASAGDHANSAAWSITQHVSSSLQES